MFIRLMMVVVGSSLMGIGVGVAVQSTLGADPLAVLWEGFSDTFSITLGTANMVIALLMLIPPLFFDRSQIGIGTILSPLLVGYFTDLVLSVTIADLPFAVDVILMVVGLLGLAVGVAIYASADLGRSTYDACIFLIHKKANIAIGKLRSAGDFLLLIFGVLMGGTISLGPIVAIFTIGPVMQMTFQKITNMNQVKLLFEE